MQDLHKDQHHHLCHPDPATCAQLSCPHTLSTLSLTWDVPQSLSMVLPLPHISYHLDTARHTSRQRLPIPLLCAHLLGYITGSRNKKKTHSTSDPANVPGDLKKPAPQRLQLRLRTRLTKQPSSITKNQDTDQDKAPRTAKCTYTQTILPCFACTQHYMGTPFPTPTSRHCVSPSHTRFASAAPQASPATLCSWAREPQRELRGTEWGPEQGNRAQLCLTPSPATHQSLTCDSMPAGLTSEVQGPSFQCSPGPLR